MTMSAGAMTFALMAQSSRATICCFTIECTYMYFGKIIRPTKKYLIYSNQWRLYHIKGIMQAMGAASAKWNRSQRLMACETSGPTMNPTENKIWKRIPRETR